MVGLGMRHRSPVFFADFYHILLIAQFELKRLFLSRKGLLFLATFALVWYFILLYPIRLSADLFAQNQHSLQGAQLFELIGFASLLNWSIPEFGVYWRFALLIFPLLCIAIAADQSCSDRVRGTLRFLNLRVSRDVLFLGRFAGVMLIQGILVLATLLMTLMLVIYRDVGLLPLAFSAGLAIVINVVLLLLPFTAMMAVLSVIVGSARQATVWAILIWSFLTGIISSLAYYLPVLGVLKVLIPGYQLSELSQLAEWQALQLAHIPLSAI